MQIVPQDLPNPDAPLVNGTYIVLNVGRSEACNGQNSPQYLSRSGNCDGSDDLRVSNLTVRNTLETKWEIALVPGMPMMKHIFPDSPSEADQTSPSHYVQC